MLKNTLIALLIAIVVVFFIKNASQTGFVFGGAEAPSATPIDSCTTITQSGYYILNASIFSGSYDPCIIIQADNVTLDCNSYSITGPRDHPGSACRVPSSYLYGIISLDSHSNITVKNCYVSNDYCRYGIHLYNVTESNIVNNTLINTSAGITAEYSINNNITKNIVDNNYEGIYFNYSDNNTITNNILSNNDWAGFDIEDSNNNYIANNIADGNDEGIYLDYSDNNTFINNTVTSSISDDIDISYSVGNIFINQYLTNLSTPINFTYDGDIILSGVAAPDSDPTGYNSIGKYISTYVGGGAAPAPPAKTPAKQSTELVQPLQKEGGGEQKKEQKKKLLEGGWLALNISYLDTDLSAVDESTLRIAKYNDSGWFTNPFIFANNFGVDTIHNVVYANMTDTMDGIFAPLGLSLSATETVNYISDCTEITEPGIYKLNQSISGNLPDGPCIDIWADDVVIDCNGYDITGIDEGSEYGVYTANFNTVIKNCNISNYTYGIYLTEPASSNKITNNTVSNNYDTGIYIEYSYNNLISNNIVNNNSYDGIYIYESSNNIITNNSVNNNQDYGIYFGGGGFDIDKYSDNNIFVNNTALNNTEWDVYIGGTLSNSFINQYITNISTPVSFNYYNNPDCPQMLIIQLKGISERPSDPYGYTNISKYIAIDNGAGGSRRECAAVPGGEEVIIPWFALNISYSNADLPIGLDESSLRIAKYKEDEETWYTDPSIFADVYGLDTRNKVVYINTTYFEELNGIFAPLGKGPIKECTNITEPGKYTLIASLLDIQSAQPASAKPPAAQPAQLEPAPAPPAQPEPAPEQPNYDKCIDIQTDNVTLNCAGYNITGLGDGYGIYSSAHSNITIKNCYISNYTEGIFLNEVNNSNIINCATYSNINNSILVYNSNKIIIENITAYNSTNGAQLVSSTYANISNSLIYNNSYGIIIFASNNSVISKNKIVSNLVYGIALYLNSTNNTIYNNNFTNEKNAYDDCSLNSCNYWNKTKSAGQNILGGPYLGGNFWSDYLGSDINYDGIGDTQLPYNASGNITIGGDYLPIVRYVPPPEEKPSGGGGEGGAPPQGQTLTIDIPTEGTTQALSLNDRVIFTIDSQQHTGRILAISYNSVVIEFTSNPIRVTINVGETKEIDLNNDGTPDISVYLEKIEQGKAYLTFKVIEHKVPEKEELPPQPTLLNLTNVTNITIQPPALLPASAQTNSALIVIIVSILMLIIAGFIIYRKIKKSRPIPQVETVVQPKFENIKPEAFEKTTEQIESNIYQGILDLEKKRKEVTEALKKIKSEGKEIKRSMKKIKNKVKRFKRSA